jgi:adenylosuccinate synthase
MPCVAIVGAQFGDEGKGKVVDYYSKDADVVIRFQGGCNAGHTVVVDGNEFKFHLVPSGAIYQKKLIIGNGAVLDLETLTNEIEEVKSKFKKIDLLISDRAHVTLPFHKILDGAEESIRSCKVGTTKRGIGPTYSDKIARFGIRIVDLLDKNLLNEKLDAIIPQKNSILRYVCKSDDSLTKDEILEYCLKYAEKIKPYIGDASIEINRAIKEGKNVLFEGAQGTLLDVDQGTYPFVTSSNTTAGGACVGSGVGPKVIDKVIGVIKAYITRVGEGPMPTELNDSIGELLKKKGNEFGATTGRPRRCGWLDGVALRFAVRVNGLDGLIVTKLDVLGGLNEIKICTSYEYSGKEINEFPASLKILEKATPVYETLSGWPDLSKEEYKEIADKGYYALPKEMRNYLKRIEEIAGIPIYLVSFGQDREATISLREIF